MVELFPTLPHGYRMHATIDPGNGTPHVRLSIQRRTLWIFWWTAITGEWFHLPPGHHARVEKIRKEAHTLKQEFDLQT